MRVVRHHAASFLLLQVDALHGLPQRAADSGLSWISGKGTVWLRLALVRAQAFAHPQHIAPLGRIYTYSPDTHRDDKPIALWNFIDRSLGEVIPT